MNLCLTIDSIALRCLLLTFAAASFVVSTAPKRIYDRRQFIGVNLMSIETFCVLW